MGVGMGMERDQRGEGLRWMDGEDQVGVARPAMRAHSLPPLPSPVPTALPHACARGRISPARVCVCVCVCARARGRISPARVCDCVCVCARARARALPS